MPDDHLGHSIINSLRCSFYKTLETPKSRRMSTPANNLGISSKSEENSSDESGQKCGFNSNVECQSLKRPRTTNSRTAQENNRSNVPTCLQFIRLGWCVYGDNCRYAHTTGSQYVPVVEQRNLGKLESCRFFVSGRACPYGNECQFLHERSKGLYRESSAIIIATTGHEVKNKTHSGTPEPKRSVDLRKKFLKTRFCTKWERTGSCSYGSTCQFAHGKAELQSLGSYNPPESWSSAGISAPAKNTASDKIGFSSLSERPRFVFKWTDIKKISQIYADWIETV